MSTLSNTAPRSTQTVRIAVTAMALAVIGCFSAAFTFADQPAAASPTQQVR